MSDISENPSAEPQEDSEGIKRLREQAGRANELEATVRRQAFQLAGVNVDSKPGQAFLSTYAGDLTPEAIKAEATDWNLLAPTPAPTTTATADEVAMSQSRSEIAVAGTPASIAPEGDPVEAAYAARSAALARGMPQVDAGVAVIDALFQAAAAGNPKYIYEPGRAPQ